MQHFYHHIVLSILLFFCSVSFLVAQSQNKLKTKIARERTKEDTTFTLYLRETYDEQGRLLSFEEPQYYCTQTFQYDTQGRKKQEDIMCGESDGNGLYYFDYQENKTIITGDLGIFVVFKIEEQHDQKGNKIQIQRWKNRADEDSTYTIEKLTYSEQNKLLTKEEYSLLFVKESSRWQSNNEIRNLTTYSYTTFDSLQAVVFTDLVNKKSYPLETYTYNKSKKVKEIVYHYESGESRKVYDYDSKGQLLKMRMESKKQGITAAQWKPDSETKFSYQNKQLVQETTATFQGKRIQNRIVNTYQQNLLLSTKEYDKQGKLVSEIIYEYTYF